MIYYVYAGPIVYKKIYHLFYQYNPYGAVYIVWAHSTSTDLINWTPQDIAIYPSQPSDIWLLVRFRHYSSFRWIYYILYRNNGFKLFSSPKSSRTGRSDPYLIKWIKYSKNPTISPTKPINSTLFRDPTTVWLGPDKKWRILIGSIIDKKGLAILYKSRVLKHWIKAHKPLYSEKHTGMWECPDFYPVNISSKNWVDTSIFGSNIKYVLKASLVNPHRDCHAIGEYNIYTDKFIPDRKDSFGGVPQLRYDYGKFYASKTFYDSVKHRRILWGWINESSSENADIKKGWSGLQVCISNLFITCSIAVHQVVHVS